MPSPFPGMDPYLEDAVHWADIHHSLISKMRGDLNSALPTGYVARANERGYETKDPKTHYLNVAGVQNSDLLEVNEPFLEVMTVPEEKVVTAIEIISPFNKTPGSEGRRQYRRRQREAVSSNASLLEIDLLHGERILMCSDTAAPMLQRSNYLICLTRGHTRNTFEIWTISVRERLPRVAVPLSEVETDCVLDLQNALDWSYDTGRYGDFLDYRNDPPVTLSPEDAVWLDAHLREQGLRD